MREGSSPLNASDHGTPFNRRLGRSSNWTAVWNRSVQNRQTGKIDNQLFKSFQKCSKPRSKRATYVLTIKQLRPLLIQCSIPVGPALYNYHIQISKNINLKTLLNKMTSYVCFHKLELCSGQVSHYSMKIIIFRFYEMSIRKKWNRGGSTIVKQKGRKRIAKSLTAGIQGPD